MNAENKQPSRQAPPLSDAASGSPSEYTIGHVRDFLKVPDHRLDECLSEFREYLKLCGAITDAAEAIAQALGIKGNVAEIGDFTWVDDGEKKRTITITPMENKKAQRPERE